MVSNKTKRIKNPVQWIRDNSFAKVTGSISTFSELSKFIIQSYFAGLLIVDCNVWLQDAIINDIGF